MNAELHLHTDAYYKGIGDGAQTVVEAIDAAAKAGATAVAITDHGNCANWVDFFNYARGKEVDHQTLEKKGLPTVKPILGVEAYINYPETLIEEKVLKEHLVLLAKDYIGYQQISRFVAETNRNIDEKDRPCGTFDMLNTVFGSDPGHVICSSACIAGVLATPLLYNSRIEREIEKIQKRIEKTEEILGADYTIAKRTVMSSNDKIEKRQSEINSLTEIASKKYGKIERSIKKETDPEKRKLLEDSLALEKAETEDAKRRIADLKAEIKDIKASTKTERDIVSKAKDKLKTIENNKASIEALKGMLKTEEELFKDASAEALRYKELFGDNFYAEIQNHGINKEAIAFPVIAKIAKDLGIKLIATNDVHIATKNDVTKRNLVRNSAEISRPWIPALIGDDELYFKTDEEKAEIISRIIPEDIVREAITNANAVADECNLDHISEANHYPEYANATEKLRELALSGKTTVILKDGREIEIASDHAGVNARYDNWTEELQKRFEYEISVIDKMGFSSYFLFIADVLNKCKTARDNATDIGPGRGSGAGSIVCYLAGITELDPIKYDLLFERFLNPSRVSMPDIDSDFSRFARQYAINYVTETYGQKSVTGIMTKAKMGAKQALTYAPKLYAKEHGLDTRTYNELGGKLRRYITDNGTHLHDIEADIMRDFANNPDALNIFKYAKMLEGTITSFGQHAAGIISIMDGQVEDYIPLIMAADPEGNEKLVIQTDMVAAEAQLGFIKFDFLGLKNLNVITACQQMVTDHYGKVMDTYNLPLDDPEVYKNIFANGNTNFVFQFESDGMKKMLKDLHPTRFEDLILAVSVYRPGPMDFIPDIIACKRGEKESEIVEKFPMLKNILAETYGYPVYQEQVMKIMTECAGFDLGHADNVRRFMSKKKEDKLAAEKPLFIQGCVEKGTSSAQDAEWLFDQLMPFAKYGFNKSHAAAYSYVSFITAYMKNYYPKEYLCAAMLEQGDKTIQLLNDCKRYEIDMLPVNINVSDVDYKVEDEHSIRMGLSAIKGLKGDAQTIVDIRKSGTYENIEDFVDRCGIKSNSMEACIKSGACDNIIRNRIGAVNYAKNLSDILSKYEAAIEKINELEANPDSKQSKIDEWRTKADDLETQIKNLNDGQTFSTDDRIKRQYEMEYLGMYLSGSPLDGYDLSNPKYKSISEVNEGCMFRTCGVINGYREITTKKGDKMAVFTLLDKDSEMVSAVIFPNKYEEISTELTDECVVEVYGRLEDHEDENQINIYDIKPLERDSQKLHINIESLDRFYTLQDMFTKNQSEYGYETFIRLCGQEEKLEFKLNKDVTKELDGEDVEYLVYD